MEKNAWNTADEYLDEYGFPETFTPAVLSQMREMLTISQDVFRNIHSYFDAAGNLYARISLRKLFEIYNNQNAPVSQENFLEAAYVIAHEPNHYAILQRNIFHEELPLSDPMDQELIAEYLYALGNDEYDGLEHSQEGKPWYVPDREEFLRYADDFYHEETPQLLALTNFLQNTQRKLHCPPQEIADEVEGLLEMDARLTDIVDDVHRLGVRFQDQQDFQMFVRLCLNLSHHTRRHSHREHTPAELDLQQRNFADVMAEVSFDDDFQDPLEAMGQLLRNNLMPAPTVTGKPSKNAPCPCGSGRKYKNCCGKRK